VKAGSGETDRYMYIVAVVGRWQTGSVAAGPWWWQMPSRWKAMESGKSSYPSRRERVALSLHGGPQRKKKEWHWGATSAREKGGIGGRSAVRRAQEEVRRQ